MGQPGDEIIIRPGNYDLATWAVGSITVKPGMNIHGEADKPRPNITSADLSDEVFDAADNSKFRHLRVKSDTDYGYPIFVAATNVIQEDLILLAPGTHGVAASVDHGGVLRDTVAYAPGTFGRGVAVQTYDAIVQVRNVTALASGDHGVGVAARTNSSGACDDTHPTTITVRNTIALGGAQDIAVRPDSYCPARFPIAMSVGTSNYRTTSVGPVAASLTSLGGNQIGLPSFQTDPGAPAYHQRPGSVTIDAGAPDPLLGAVDPDGEARILGDAPDIGADETAKPVPATLPAEPPAAPVPAPVAPSGDAGQAGSGVAEATAAGQTDAGGQGAAGGEGAGEPTTPAATPAICTLGAVRTDTGKRTVAAAVSCTGPVSGALTGRMTVGTAKGARRYRLAGVSVRVDAGSPATLRLKLTKRAATAVRRAKRGTLHLTFAVTDAAGAAIERTATARVKSRG